MTDGAERPEGQPGTAGVQGTVKSRAVELDLLDIRCRAQAANKGYMTLVVSPMQTLALLDRLAAAEAERDDHMMLYDAAIATIKRLRERGNALAATLRLIMARMRGPGESYSSSFERTAQEFYEATGLMAPGKHQPPEMGDNNQERQANWDEWVANRNREIWDDTSSAIAGWDALNKEQP